MAFRSHVALVSVVALFAGCTSFTGTNGEPNNGAAPLREVYPPPPTFNDDAFRYITADGVLRETTDNDYAPTVAYCLLQPPAQDGAPPHWTTCNAYDSVMSCGERQDSACAEYPSSDIQRAMACSFEVLSQGRPTCVPMQYSRSVCDDCGAQTCHVYADGSHECRANGDGPSRPEMGVCTRTADGMVFDVGMTPDSGGTFTDELRCVGGTDCLFTVDGEARCTKRAELLARYPIRGCDHSAVGDSMGCHVRESGEGGLGQYSSAPPTNSGITFCSARRELQNTPWTDLPWDLTVEAEQCRSGELCDLEDPESAGCIDPKWSLNIADGDRRYVCGDCLGVPCFVYEDGSYECTHTPTRATESGESGVPCCRKLPENEGFELGVSVAGARNNRFDTTTPCANAQTRCDFNSEGLPTCQ